MGAKKTTFRRLNILMFLIFFAPSDGFSQSFVGLEYSYGHVFSTKNTVSDDFNYQENGNLQINSINSSKFYYERTINSKNKLKLRSSLEFNLQKYTFPYYQKYPFGNDIKYDHSFSALNTNLSIGFQKDIPLVVGKLDWVLGVDLVARTLKSNGEYDTNLEYPSSFYNDTVFIKFDVFNPVKGGNVVLQLNTSLNYKIVEWFSIYGGVNFAPRYQIGFNYEITNVEVVIEDGNINRFFERYRSENETLTFNYLQFFAGIKFNIN